MTLTPRDLLSIATGAAIAAVIVVVVAEMVARREGRGA